MYPGTFAAKTPDKAAVIVAETGAVTTYAELDRGSARLARYLNEQGLRRGDVVAVLSDNNPRVFEIYWAAQRSGLYITMVNRYLTPAEIAYIVTDSGATALIVAGVAAETAAEVAKACPTVTTRLAADLAVDGYLDYDEALREVSSEPLPDQPRGSDLLYSSGTTGRPKGIKAALPNRQVDEPGDTLAGVFGPMYGFGEDTVYLSPAPLYHSAPLRFCATIQSFGGTVVMMRKFDAEGALQAIERYGVTHSQWVPTMFVRMLKLPPEVRAKYDTSTLRVAIHAAAPCPVEVKEQMIAWWGPVLYEYYASTENNGITLIDSAQWLVKRGSVGQAGLGVIRVCDEDGQELPTGESGLVYFERDEMPFRYHNDEEKTRAARHPVHPNWSTTGDVGYVDSDGFLFLNDRQAFVIISGGVNIYPQEIENTLTLHPMVTDVAVVGVPDDEMGQSVKAFVQPSPEAVPGPELEAELIEYVRARIARFKAPKQIEFVETLPRTETGKLQKSRLT